jgi:porphobilinogen synthase
MTFPTVRLRRLRNNPVIRRLVSEPTWQLNNLVYPIIVNDRRNCRQPTVDMPEIFIHSADNAVIEAGQAIDDGVQSILLMGCSDEKDPEATAAWSEQGPIPAATRALRKQFDSTVAIIGEVSLTPYMPHGYGGIIMGGQVLNDPTIEVMARAAVVQAEAGVDMVLIRELMDGRVMWIRDALDDAGHDSVGIITAAANMSSALNQTANDLQEARPELLELPWGYETNPANVRDAMAEAGIALAEGVDMVYVQPAMLGLDVIRVLRESVHCPIAAFQTPGEYAWIKAGVSQLSLHEADLVNETLSALKRAGATTIFTFYARQAAQWQT